MLALVAAFVEVEGTDFLSLVDTAALFLTSRKHGITERAHEVADTGWGIWRKRLIQHDQVLGIPLLLVRTHWGHPCWWDRWARERSPSPR
jgi:hypothetical protein